MLEKRRQAISSYKNITLLHKLTLSQAKTLFPQRTKTLLSPKSLALTDRESLMQHIKHQTIADQQKKNEKQFRHAPASSFFKPKAVASVASMKEKHSRQDTFREQIEKTKRNMGEYKKYAVRLKGRLRNGALEGEPTRDNQIRKPEFADEPDPELIQALVDQQNFQYQFASKQSDPIRHSRNFSQHLNPSIYLSAPQQSQPSIKPTLRFSKLRKMDVDSKLLKAIQQLKQSSKKIHKHTKQSLQGWNRTNTFSQSDNQKRAQILYVARWNQTLTKVLQKYQLEKYEFRLLERYFGEPYVLLTDAVLKERDLLERFEENRRFIRDIPEKFMSGQLTRKGSRDRV